VSSLNNNANSLIECHQSTEAFNMFDNLLLLEQGGRQVYFGPRSAALDYFDMASDTPDNPAEILLHIASSENDVLDITSPLSTKWRLSPQAAASQATIGALSTAVLACPLPVKAPGVLQQCYELTKRVSRHFYRDPSFSYTKVATATSVATIIGLSFFGVGRELTIVSFQNRMFTIFLVLFIPPVFMNLVIFKQHRLRGLFDQREGPSKIYGETAFVTSLIISELPYSIICGSIYFCIFYFLGKFLRSSSVRTS
jgi:ATP-binding cassette subfamily G (WHITE) protein 2 (SNQ2)